jgi:hypothetical protein
MPAAGAAAATHFEPPARPRPEFREKRAARDFREPRYMALLSYVTPANSDWWLLRCKTWASTPLCARIGGDLTMPIIAIVQGRSHAEEAPAPDQRGDAK